MALVHHLEVSSKGCHICALKGCANRFSNYLEVQPTQAIHPWPGCCQESCQREGELFWHGSRAWPAAQLFVVQFLLKQYPPRGLSGRERASWTPRAPSLSTGTGAKSSCRTIHIASKTLFQVIIGELCFCKTANCHVLHTFHCRECVVFRLR